MYFLITLKTIQAQNIQQQNVQVSDTQTQTASEQLTQPVQSQLTQEQTKELKKIATGYIIGKFLKLEPLSEIDKMLIPNK